MYGFLLQDWVTIRGATSVTSFIQNETDWMGFSSFQDVAFWVDVREVTLGGATNLKLQMQTSPTKDETLFQTLTNCELTITTVSSPPLITPLPRNILSTNPAIPLATWVRWAISVTGSPSSAWTITFRVLASANRVSD